MPTIDADAHVMRRLGDEGSLPAASVTKILDTNPSAFYGL